MRHLVYAFCLSLLASVSHAHHSTVANFTREIISVDGVIEQVRYQNPHASVLIRHIDPSGNDVYWLIETAAKTTLQRKGITLDVLAVGVALKRSRDFMASVQKTRKALVGKRY